MLRRRADEEPVNLFPCFLCRQQFQFGPHRYAGRGVPKWGIRICEPCDKANHDGVVVEYHPELVRHLVDRGVEIRLNDRGWLPIPR